MGDLLCGTEDSGCMRTAWYNRCGQMRRVRGWRVGGLGTGGGNGNGNGGELSDWTVVRKVPPPAVAVSEFPEWLKSNLL